MVGKSGRALRASALTLAILAFALSPLVAQYLKQRVMVSDDNFAMIAPVSVARAPAPHRAVVHKHHRAIKRRSAPRIVAAMNPPVVHNHVSAAKPAAVHKPFAAHKPTAVALRTRHHTRHARRSAPRDPKAQLARAAVTGYLERVIAGEIKDAPEKHIVSAWTDIHIRYVQRDGQGIRLGVDLSGPQGHYFEVFVVDRVDMQILEHSFVQV